MGKNVLIFSDGTGQVGGIAFDENRTNVYKLYRATRVCPDSTINPDEQVAFYDPGLGSQKDGGHLAGRFTRWLYNTVSQATGLGITANIIDCYAAIIRLWKPGDRIFLFGFSRGAYTARCLAAVIANCGVPTRNKDGSKLKLDVASTRKLASYAVKHVYQFTTSRPRAAASKRQKFLLDTRDKIAARFRKDFGAEDAAIPAQANTYPYFIGVFDTVAALGSFSKTALLSVVYAAATALISYAVSFIPALVREPLANTLAAFLSFGTVWATLLFVAAAFIVALFFSTHIKFDFTVPGYTPRQTLATIHLTDIWQTFYDYTLNDNVQYAKHAISIDENRKDFARVKWGKKEGTGRKDRNPDGSLWFEQVWFPGNHADLGGGYPENESRLSDAALRWMHACAATIPDGIKCDKTVLNLYPRADGIQHDERKSGFGLLTSLFGITWTEGIRTLPGDPPHEAILHRSVYDRFDVQEVVHYDEVKQYRPLTLKQHIDLEAAYKPGGVRDPEPKCIAEFVESKL
jgi:hypothetical protein